MNLAKRLFLGAAAAVSIFILQSSALAKPESWTDTQGNRFKGEPVSLHGPFALFKTSKYASRRVLLQYLAPSDCLRLSAALAARPAPAADWSRSSSVLAQDLRGNLCRIEGDKSFPADLPSTPEPRFLVVVYGNHGDGKAWDMLGRAAQACRELRQEFPGTVEFLFFGLKHSSRDHRAMATSMGVSWLVADFASQSRMTSLVDLAPGEGYGIQILTPEGIPVFSDMPGSAAATDAFFASFKSFLELGLEGNHRAWKDRTHYLRATLPAAHANDSVPPTLVGHPLGLDQLRKNGATRLRATLRISAEGEVSQVELSPEGLPQALLEPVRGALKYCAFVPAITKGRFVEGVYTLALDL